MRQQGRLTDWNDDRGFGFITPLSGGATLFAHVSEFPRSQRRPIVTDLVTYVADADDRGRPRAADIRFLAPTRARETRHDQVRASSADRPATAIALGFFALLAVVGAFNRAMWVVLLVDVVLSAATVTAYRFDKLAARQGQWRAKESSLHLLALLGGWPGALVAQQWYHHKTRKQSFQVTFWFTVVGNIGMTWLVAITAAAAAAAG